MLIYNRICNRDEKFDKVLKIYDYWGKQQLLIEKDKMRLNKEVRSGNQNYQQLFKTIEQLRDECWKMLANNDLIDKIIVDNDYYSVERLEKPTEDQYSCTLSYLKAWDEYEKNMMENIRKEVLNLVGEPSRKKAEEDMSKRTTLAEMEAYKKIIVDARNKAIQRMQQTKDKPNDEIIVDDTQHSEQDKKIIVDDTQHSEQDKEIIVEKVELTTVSDEYGHKTYKHTEETKEKIRKALKAFHADKTNPKWIKWYNAIKAYHAKRKAKKKVNADARFGKCVICGATFETTDKTRVCCYSKKGACQKRYNHKKKKRKKSDFSSGKLEKYYKLKILKNTVKILRNDDDYKNLLFSDEKTFIELFDNKVKEARNKEIIPLRIGMSIETIKKFFGNEVKFLKKLRKVNF